MAHLQKQLLLGKGGKTTVILLVSSGFGQQGVHFTSAECECAVLACAYPKTGVRVMYISSKQYRDWCTAHAIQHSSEAQMVVVLGETDRH